MSRAAVADRAGDPGVAFATLCHTRMGTTMRHLSALTSLSARRLCLAGLLVMWAPSVIVARGTADDLVPPVTVPSEADIPTFALTWFTDMQAGRFNRAQYAPAYAAQLTDDTVVDMSKLLNQYGASPFRAETLRKHVTTDQTIYEVKLIFPRGDSSSLLFGFDSGGKITGVAVMSMPGD